MGGNALDLREHLRSLLNVEEALAPEKDGSRARSACSIATYG